MRPSSGVLIPVFVYMCGAGFGFPRAAIPMTVIICACGVAATVFNFTMLGSRLDSGPAPIPAPIADAPH